MIKTVIFDIGNVLVGFDWYDFYKNQGFDDAMAQRLGRATAQDEDWKEYDRGCMTDKEIEDLFVENDPEIEGQIRSALKDFHGLLTRYDYAIDWIVELKEKGYRVLVLSNFSDKALKEFWNVMDFLPYVDGGILSFKYKLIKPDPAIYHLIMEKYSLKAQECVFIDDSQANVEGAISVGMHSFRFENQAQAKAELKKLGVE